MMCALNVASKEPITNDDIAAKYIRMGIPRGKIDKQECFVVLVININYILIGRPILASMGTANNVNIHPRDIFREAIKRNGIAIISGHNHPSGNMKPSTEDFLLAKRLEECGKILGIDVLDSLIVSKTSHISRQEGNWK